MTRWDDKKQYRRVLFTANIPADRAPGRFTMEELRTRLNPSYIMAQLEEGGHVHWQGYFEMAKKTLGNKIRGIFEAWGIKAHLEQTNKTSEQNKTYCTKNETCKDKASRFEFGAMLQQGARSDLATLFSAAASGASALELAELDPGRWAVHRNALQEYSLIKQPKRS